MLRLWYEDYQRERCVRPGRSRTGTRSSVLPTVHSNRRSQSPADKCLDISWGDFPRTGWYHRVGRETTPDVDERRGDLASIEGQCPLPLQDRVQQLCVGIVENLPKCPTLDGSIYGRLRLNQWPMGYPRPQVRLMAYCFF